MQGHGEAQDAILELSSRLVCSLWSRQGMLGQPVTSFSGTPLSVSLHCFLFSTDKLQALSPRFLHSALFPSISCLFSLCVFQVHISHRGTQPSRMCPFGRGLQAMFLEHYLIIYRKLQKIRCHSGLIHLQYTWQAWSISTVIINGVTVSRLGFHFCDETP